MVPESTLRRGFSQPAFSEKRPCFLGLKFNPDSDAQDEDHLHARAGDGKDRDLARVARSRGGRLPAQHESRETRVGARARAAPPRTRRENEMPDCSPARYPGAG